MLTLDELCSIIDPRKTALVLGAGAAIPSGAPSGVQLSRELARELDDREISDDLAECASILENRLGRKVVADAVAAILSKLQPAGGLLTLPHLEFPAVFTTNFDQLLESAYKRAGKKLTPVRSNFEYAKPEEEGGTPYYKIHGCISQDTSRGQSTGMTLTESDYRTYADYRQSLFMLLQLRLTAGNVLIIGQSLKDPHLKDMVSHAGDLRREQGASGRIFCLVYERDDDRAALLEARGVEVTFGGIDDLVESLLAQPSFDGTDDEFLTEDILPPRLLASTSIVKDAVTEGPNPGRLFNGAAATVADVAADLTFRREVETKLMVSIRSREKLATAILGNGGVGKTSLARKLAYLLQREDFHVWEHRSHAHFYRAGWVGVEASLRSRGEAGILLVDDCPKFLGGLNHLLDSLAALDEPALQVLVTANSTDWRPRVKSPAFYSRGNIETLSELAPSEIDGLLRILDSQPSISKLVDRSFSSLARPAQRQQLLRRCKADMFVCLKNIFASDNLDNILLREYADLREELQDIYRHVCFVESTGARVHRQLVIRLLGLDAGQIDGLLGLLEGVVDEYDIDPDDGLYGWTTRHVEIAKIITRYKFSDDEERERFLGLIIDASNPSVHVERELLREICNRRSGVGTLEDPEARERLLRRVVERAPRERVPRHRLIQALLEANDYERADREISMANDEVGIDPPIARYAVEALLLRAKQSEGILDEDRVAILRDAERQARFAIRKFPADKYAYRSLLNVGVEIERSTKDATAILDAHRLLIEAHEERLDPDLEEVLAKATTALQRAGY